MNHLFLWDNNDILYIGFYHFFLAFLEEFSLQSPANHLLELEFMSTLALDPFFLS